MTAVILDRVVLERGSFRLEADTTFGPGVHIVRGRIGAGKSTLALALAGGLAPASGKIRFDGVGRRIWVGQSPGHHLTGETVEREIGSWGLAPRPLITRIGLADMAASDPFLLSRGEQQRLVLGCALASDPDLLVLDEPFAPLDVPARVSLGRLLEVRRGLTIVTTHTDSYGPTSAARWLVRDGTLEPEER